MRGKEEKGITLRVSSAAAAAVVLLLLVLMAATCGKKSSRTSTPPPAKPQVKIVEKPVEKIVRVPEKPPEGVKDDEPGSIINEPSSDVSKPERSTTQGNKLGDQVPTTTTATQFLIDGSKALREKNFMYAINMLTNAINKGDFESERDKAGAYWNRAIANKGEKFEDNYQRDLNEAMRIDRSVPKPDGLDVGSAGSIAQKMYDPIN